MLKKHQFWLIFSIVTTLNRAQPESTLTQTATNHNDDILIAFLANYGNSKVILGALPLAIEVVNNRTDLLPGRRLRFASFNTGPSASLRPHSLRFMTTMRDRGAVAFIGPDESCTTEALLASAWNIPMLSYVRMDFWISPIIFKLFGPTTQYCTDSAVSDKRFFPTFARTLAPAAMVSKSVVALLMAFDWHRFVLVGSSQAWSAKVTDAIKV